MIELIILMGLACGWLTKVFLLEKEDEVLGPWPVDHTMIYFEADADDPPHLQPAVFFDRIRFIFGVYDEKLDGEQRLWIVKPERAAVWQCPICLSFWMALPLTFIILLTGSGLLWLIPLHFAITAFSTAYNFLVFKNA